MITERNVKQGIVAGVLGVLAFVTLVPFAMTILLSQKTNSEIYTKFWAIPEEFHFNHFAIATDSLWPYMLNSIIVGTVAVLGVLLLSSMAGYVFARMRFAGKGLLYAMLLSLLMIPGILTLIPSFQWMLSIPFVGGNDAWGHGGTGLRDTWFALWIPYWSGGQIFGILLCRTFFETLPEQLFEAARVDGAGELVIYWKIVLPLSLPILATLAIMQFVGTYNDYIWPLVIISSRANQVFSVGVTQFASDITIDLAPQMAGYIVGSLPLVILFFFGMRYYVQGLTSGALKA